MFFQVFLLYDTSGVNVWVTSLRPARRPAGRPPLGAGFRSAADALGGSTNEEQAKGTFASHDDDDDDD